jgi:tRNA pseudouridine13 synthase
MLSNQTPKVDLPYLSAELPGVGGAIKRFDEDFVVEEMPRYEPSGVGTHVYFTIEKRGLPTLAAIQHIARALGRQPRDIGYAGMKDAHGVTRQMLSLEHIDPARIESLALSRIKVLSISRHTNKLKLGHLAGNRFVIKIRDADKSPDPAARAIVDVLARRGVPNYFGPQRFGARGDNALIGKAVLLGNHEEAIALMLGRPGPLDRGDALRARELFEKGDYAAAADAWPRGTFAQQSRMCRALAKSGGDKRQAWRTADHTLRKLFLSAFQSDLFNRVLARRIELGLLDRLQTGDVAYKHANGACFHVEDAAVEQPRCDAFDISPTGPLFGRRMTPASGEHGELESTVMAGSGVGHEELSGRDSGRLDGARRPLRVPLGEVRVESGEDDHGPSLLLAFALPAGAYATNVIREVCKNQAD